MLGSPKNINPLKVFNVFEKIGRIKKIIWKYNNISNIFKPWWPIVSSIVPKSEFLLIIKKLNYISYLCKNTSTSFCLWKASSAVIKKFDLFFQGGFFRGVHCHFSQNVDVLDRRAQDQIDQLVVAVVDSPEWAEQLERIHFVVRYFSPQNIKLHQCFLSVWSWQHWNRSLELLFWISDN